MQRSIFLAFVVAVSASTAAWAQPMSAAPPGYAMPTTPRMVLVAQPPQMRANLGGGFIEFLFGDRAAPPPAAPPPVFYPRAGQDPQRTYANTAPAANPTLEQRPPGFEIDPRYLRQAVDYQTKEEPGTVVIDTPHHFLYLVEEGGKARRYGIGVGRPGFTWSGVHTVSAKKEWPDWVPPTEMIQRQPYLPHFMPGGPNNPLGARALYLGSTLYRIHGSNEPWTIGHNVSSGCIRMRDADVIDLYDRVKVGTKVVVL
jgi:lipoprotein-anchoring transpeptidase ErfK/SrfK